jgi:hypothetical protein
MQNIASRQGYICMYGVRRRADVTSETGLFTIGETNSSTFELESEPLDSVRAYPD